MQGQKLVNSLHCAKYVTVVLQILNVFGKLRANCLVLGLSRGLDGVTLLDDKPDNLSTIPRTHKVKGKGQLLRSPHSGTS